MASRWLLEIKKPVALPHDLAGRWILIRKEKKMGTIIGDGITFDDDVTDERNGGFGSTGM